RAARGFAWWDRADHGHASGAGGARRDVPADGARRPAGEPGRDPPPAERRPHRRVASRRRLARMNDRPDLGPLHRIAHDVAAEWGIEVGPPFALSRYSFVAPAGHDAVLKVTPPEDDESDEEAEALAL